MGGKKPTCSGTLEGVMENSCFLGNHELQKKKCLDIFTDEFRMRGKDLMLHLLKGMCRCLVRDGLECVQISSHSYCCNSSHHTDPKYLP